MANFILPLYALEGQRENLINMDLVHRFTKGVLCIKFAAVGGRQYLWEYYSKEALNAEYDRLESMFIRKECNHCKLISAACARIDNQEGCD